MRVFHNNTVDEYERHTAMVDGYRPSDTVTEVFAYIVDPDDLTPLETAFRLFNVGHEAEFGPVDERAVDYRARGNRSFSIGDVLGLEDETGTTVFHTSNAGWQQIEPPTIDNRQAPDELTVPIDRELPAMRVTAAKLRLNHFDQATGLFERRLALVAGAGYPIAGDMWTLRDKTEQHLLDLADRLAEALSATRLCARGKTVPGPDGEPGGTQFWLQRAENLSETLVDACTLAAQPAAQ